jgi:hypothetical protein
MPKLLTQSVVLKENQKVGVAKNSIYKGGMIDDGTDCYLLLKKDDKLP